MAEFMEPKPHKPGSRKVTPKRPETDRIPDVFIHYDEQAKAAARAEANACGAFRKALVSNGFSSEEAFELTRERFFPGIPLEED